MSTEPPEGLREAGGELWRLVQNDYELSGAEETQLLEACFVRDQIAALRQQLATDGTMLGSSQGMRLHPAIAEIRAQQLTLARLLATLQLPAPAEDQLPASTGVRRRFYAMGGTNGQTA